MFQSAVRSVYLGYLVPSGLVPAIGQGASWSFKLSTQERVMVKHTLVPIRPEQGVGVGGCSDPRDTGVSVSRLLPNILQVPTASRRLVKDGARDKCAIKSPGDSVSDRQGATS